MIRNLRELYQYRSLLWALVIRELSARYRASVLGFLWTFLNPTLNMLVYGLVFGVILDSPQPRYPYFLFTGLLPWINFSSAVVGGTTAVSDRKDLLSKVRFPAQVLPGTVVTTNLINFLLSLPLLLLLGAVYGEWPTWHFIFLMPVLLAQTLFTLALTYLLSALNVAFRDLQHIVGNVMQMAFFLTPVLWDISNLKGLHRWGFELTVEQEQAAITYGNPLAAIMISWRDIFYFHRVPQFAPLVWVVGLSLLMLWGASAIFERRREEFAELV